MRFPSLPFPSLPSLRNLPQVTGEMYDWWFGWHLVDSARYKLWNPVAHQYAWRWPDAVDWADKTLPQRYVGAFSQIDEYVGNEHNQLTIAFVEPGVLGFGDRGAWAQEGVEAVVVARIIIGGFGFFFPLLLFFFFVGSSGGKVC